MRTPRLAASLAGCAAVALTLGTLGLAPAASGSTSARPFLIRDVRASVDDIPLKHVTYPIGAGDPQPDTQTEPSIAVNPGDPRNAVAAFQEDRVDSGGDAGNGYTATFDGGRTWTHGYLRGLTRDTGGTFDRASDAVVAYGADPDRPGHYLVYVNSLVFNDGSGPDGDTSRSGMAINVSKDGGRTWSDAVILEQDGLAGLNDKNWLVADNGTGTGHTTGRVYVVWDRITPMVYSYCDADCDQLASWTGVNNGTFYVFDPQPGIGSIPMVLPDGTLGVVFQGDFGGVPSVPSSPTDQPELNVAGAQLQYAEARGAGSVPWPAPLPFTQASAGIAANRGEPVAEQRAGTLPAAAADPKTGRIYVAWEDGRYRSDGLNDIVLTSSTDRVTWTKPVAVDPGPRGNHVNHWNAMLDVDRKGGVHVGWRQRVERHGDPTGRSVSGLSPRIDTYYAESSDHGKTWTAPLKVNRRTTDVGYAAFSRRGAFLGDYNQLATATNGTTYLVHNEALPKRPGEKCNCSFTAGNGHQHQYTYVAVIGRRVVRHGQGSSPGPGTTSDDGGPTRVVSHPQDVDSLARTGAAAALPLAGVALLALAAALHRRSPR